MSRQTSRAEILFTAAAELSSAEERAAFLQGECAGDAVLRAEVETMLGASGTVGGDFHDARTVIEPSDATMLIPEAGNAGATISSQPVRGGTAAGGGTRHESVTLPEESYAVGGEIARGGMGSILEAEDRKLGRKVAMKVMRLEAGATEDQRQRFIREATVLARLEHPNIVPIHELGWDAENRLFYTMKLVQGRTLQAILNGLKARDADFTRYYTLDRMLTIFRKICDALSMAHAKGVIHRDLKPENVMVGEFGEVLVMDWGIAKVTGGRGQESGIRSQGSEGRGQADDAPSLTPDSRLLTPDPCPLTPSHTLDGSIMGTPHYMSPEQAEGHVSEIDQQSDVFSLGAVLYALLTLHPPVEATSIREVLERIRRGEIRPPTTFNVTTTKTGGKGQSLEGAAADPKQFQPLPHCPGGKVPAALSSVAMKALTVDKARRYATVEAFAADIEKYQSGFATSAEHAGLFTQLRLLVQRHKPEFAIGFAAWLVITALAVWFVTSLREKERRAVAEADRATKAEQNAKTSEAVAVQEKEAARKSAASANLNLADAALREADSAGMQAALKEVPEDLRDATWRYLLDQSDTSIARIRTEAEYIGAVAAHPRQPGVFAVVEDKRNVSLIEVRSGRRLLKFTPEFPPKMGGNHYQLAFSPNGERIAVGAGNGGGGIVIHSASDGKKLAEWAAPETSRLEFSADGKLLLQTVATKSLNMWDTAGGQLAWEYANSQNSKYIHGTFTADGQQVLTFSSRDGYRMVGAPDGAIIRSLKHENELVTGLAMGMNGAAAAADRQGFVSVLDLQDGRILSKFHAFGKAGGTFTFSPAGDEIVTGAVLPDGRQSIQTWQTTTGERRQALLGGSGDIRGFGVHPISGALLVSGTNTRAWSLTGKSPAWSLSTGLAGMPPVFWGSDELLFTPAERVGKPALRKLQPGSPALLWRNTKASEARVSVSGDGKLAAFAWADVEDTLLLLRNPGPQPEEVRTLKLARHPDLVRLGASGERVAVVEDRNRRVELFDTATGAPMTSLESGDVKRTWDLGWLGGGQRLVGLVTARAERGTPDSEERIVLWDVVSSKIIQSVTHRSALNALVVAPDGRRFAEAGADKLVRIRDAATLAVQQEFRAHDGPITALAWHPTKPILATTSADLTVRLWDLDTGRRLEEFRGPKTTPIGLGFSPTGQRLACVSLNDATRIWEPESIEE